jgi:predicted RNase H-like HicB family nuclease
MSTVVYVAIVEGSERKGYSAFFPDLPGCVAASDSMVELIADARDALALHLEGLIEDGGALPPPSALEAIATDPEVIEAGRLLVDAEIEDAPVRVNISIGAGLLKRVDTAAQVRGMTRSALLAEAARQFMGGAPETPGLREPPPPTFSED